MTFDECDGIISKHTADRIAMCQLKAREYANSEDRLANFKRNAAILGISPETILMVYMMKHIDAIGHFVKSGGSVGSEPIEGRIMDAQNYLDLLICLLAERKHEN